MNVNFLVSITVLWLHKILTLGELGWRVYENSTIFYRKLTTFKSKIVSKWKIFNIYIIKKKNSIIHTGIARQCDYIKSRMLHSVLAKKEANTMPPNLPSLNSDTGMLVFHQRRSSLPTSLWIRTIWRNSWSNAVHSYSFHLLRTLQLFQSPL